MAGAAAVAVRSSPLRKQWVGAKPRDNRNARPPSQSSPADGGRGSVAGSTSGLPLYSCFDALSTSGQGRRQSYPLGTNGGRRYSYRSASAGYVRAACRAGSHVASSEKTYASTNIDPI